MDEAMTSVRRVYMQKVCRICTSLENTYFSIYEVPKTGDGSMSLYEMLVKLFPKVFNEMQVQSDEAMNRPSKICQDCKANVTKAYRLYELCVGSADRLGMLTMKDDPGPVPRTLRTVETYQSVQFVNMDYFKCTEPRVPNANNGTVVHSAAYKRFYGNLSTSNASEGTLDQQNEPSEISRTEKKRVSASTEKVRANNITKEEDLSPNQQISFDAFRSSPSRSLQSASDYTESKNNKTKLYGDRKKVISYRKMGMSEERIARMLNLKRASVNAIIKKYRVAGMLAAGPHGSEGKTKLTPAIVELVKSWLNEDCSMTLRAICRKVQDCFNITVSPATVSRAIDGFYFSFARVKISSSINTAEILRARKDYSTELSALLELIPETAMVYVHGVDLSAKTRMADPADHKEYRRVQSKNWSVMCAINSEEVLHYSAFSRAMNEQSVLKFIYDLKSNLVRKNIHHVVMVMDPERFYHNEEIQNAIEGETTALLCLPPHSTLLNPLEAIFSRWTEFIRRANPKNEEELIEAMKSGASFITAEDCKACIRDARDFSIRCMEEEELH